MLLPFMSHLPRLGITKESRMYSRIKVFIVLFSLLLLIPVAHAETPFDVTSCVVGPATALSSSKELMILGADFKGIIMSNHENKVFDNFVSQFVGISRIMRGQVDAVGYTKLTDLDGDIIYGKTTCIGPMGKAAWKWILFHGTGKWKGITGSADVHPITKGQTLVKGVWRGCYRITGTFELPPK
jgi:hypothetical protein